MDIEKYIQENKDNFDIENPNNEIIWTGIQNGLKKNKRKNFNYWKVAAILLLLITTPYIIVKETKKNNKQNIEYSLVQENCRLQEIEQEYHYIINQKQKELNFATLQNNEIIKFLIQELNMLDTIYNEAVKDMEQNGLHKTAGGLVDAIRIYLGNRLQVPAGSLVFTDVAEHLKRNGVDAESLTDLQDILEWCEAYHYGGIDTNGSGETSLEKTFDNVLPLFEKIDRCFRK